MILNGLPFRISLALLLLASPCLASESIDGKWDVVWDTEGGIRTQQWTITSDGSAVTLKLDSVELQGTFEGGQLTFGGNFHSAEAGYSAELKGSGVLKDGKLSGRATWDQYGMTFSAERAK